MLKLSRSVYEEYAKSHRALWRWCAETGEYKHRYPGWFGNLNKYPRYTVKYISSYKHAHILNDCFACEIFDSCFNCPFVKKYKTPCLTSGPYIEFDRGRGTRQDAIEIAQLFIDDRLN